MPREHLEQNHAEGIDIAGCPSRLSSCLFWTRVFRGHRSRPGGSLGCLGQTLQNPYSSRAEIQQLGHAIGCHEDVAGLDVEMDYPFLMRIFHRRTNTPEEPYAIPRRQLADLAPLVDSHAFHIFEDQIGQNVFGGTSIE